MDRELKLHRLAESMDVDVGFDHAGILLPHDLGAWFPTERKILIRPHLGRRNYLHTLAHELGHAHHRHPAGHNSRYEGEADSYAAYQLIDPHEYAEAELLYDGLEGAIAQELEITLHLLRVWKSSYQTKAA